MKSSIGTGAPGEETDADQDGAPDQAEQDFAHDGKHAPPAAPSAPHPSPANDQDDDGGLESSRHVRGTVNPSLPHPPAERP